MSLEIQLYCNVELGGKEPERIGLFQTSITANLLNMGKRTGHWEFIWEPGENNIWFAYQMRPFLESAITFCLENKEFLSTFNHKSGYGTYEEFLTILQEYLEACKRWPLARIYTS
jgi:hypothetical protein